MAREPMHLVEIAPQMYGLRFLSTLLANVAYQRCLPTLLANVSYYCQRDPQ